MRNATQPPAPSGVEGVSCALPIAVGYGAGGEARQPLGLVVVGGLLFSQLVTLFLTPVVYTYMAQLQSWMKSRQSARTLTPATAGK